jgi:hypothetical protein
MSGTDDKNYPTPRTDAAATGIGRDDPYWYVDANFARQLERELAEANARAIRWQKRLYESTPSASVQTDEKGRPMTYWGGMASTPSSALPTPKNVTEAFERWMDATYPDWRKVEMRFHSGALYDAYRAAASTASATVPIPEGCTPTDAMVLREANHQFAEENHNLRRCLRWYANGEHIVGFSTWEGPSGDDNWLCPPMHDEDALQSSKADFEQFIATIDEHMIEDGAVARATLRSGKFEVESPEDEPKVIEGEPEWHIEQQAKSSTSDGTAK